MGQKENYNQWRVVWSNFNYATPNAIEPTVFHFTSMWPLWWCHVHQPHHTSTNFEAKLENPSLTRFMSKQATRCRHVSSHHLHPPIGFEAQTDKPPPTWFLGPNQETVMVILRPKSPNQRPWFWDPNQETVTLVLRPNHWQPLPLVLRLNQKTRASHILYVYDADHTRRHSTSWSFDHQVPDLYLIIPYPLQQVSSSCFDPHCCPSCHIRYLHIMRQASMFLHTE
jgi:hypothetical protein